MFTERTIIRTSTKQLKENKMDMSKYEQMPDLPNADIDFLNDLDDTLLGRPAEDYECAEQMQIRQELEDEQESEAQYQRDLREFKFKRSIF